MTEPLHTHLSPQSGVLLPIQPFSPFLRRPNRWAIAAAAVLVCALPNVSRAQDAVQPQASPVDIAPLPAAKPAPKPSAAVPQSGEKPALPAPAEDAPADRASAYYHAALADTYEDMATNTGRQE